MERKRKQNAKRKSSKEFKRGRRDLRKKKNQKTHSMERREGVSYESGIALRQSAEEKTAITSATLGDLKSSLTEEEFNSYAESINKINNLDNESPTLPESTDNRTERDYLFLAFDTETTGLARNSELLQIACTSHDGTCSFSIFLLPEKQAIADSSTKVHGISVQYRNGTKVLMKRGAQLSAVSQRQGLNEFCRFLKQQKEKRNLVIIAHNFLSYQVIFLDSLKLISTEMKQKSSPITSLKSKSLSDLYEFLLNEKFDAHDAREDVAALARILFTSPLNLSVERLVDCSVSSKEFMQRMQSALEAESRKSTLRRMPFSESMKDKLGKAGFDLGTMEKIFKKGSNKGLLAMLALPSTYKEIGHNNAKPRVTKQGKVLTKIVNFFHAAN